MIALSGPIAKIPEFGIGEGAIGVLKTMTKVYISVDIMYKASLERKRSNNKKAVAVAALDTAIWHSFASIILPGLVVTTFSKFWIGLCSMLGVGIKAKVYSTVFLGLATMPFIMKPLDVLTNEFMDSTVRLVYSDIYKTPQSKL